MHVILPSIFGIRMCFRCPDCNIDRTDHTTRNVVDVSCQDCMGSNMKTMGGYAGLATGMAFATEYQGEATHHGHGFVSLANMYQHHNLEEIGKIIEKNHKGISAGDMLHRVKNFVNHLQREDHFDDEQHQKNLQSLGSEFNTNNAGPLKNIHLSVRPTSMYDCSKSPCAWASQASTRSADDATGRRASEDLRAKVAADAKQFQRTYEADVQFIRKALP